MSSITDFPGESPLQSFAAATAYPVKPSHHLQSLDVLRGIAVLGGIFVSIWIFGGFSENRQNGLLLQSKGWNYRLFSTMSLLLEGKMRALIAIVFGAAMVLYLFRDNTNRQMQNADFFIRRQMWLLAFGLVNSMVFLWTNDLLFHLGIMGVLLFAFVRLSARGLLIAAILTTIIYCGKNYWRYADDQKVYNKYLSVLAVEKNIKNDSLAKARKNVVAGKLIKDSAIKQQGRDTLTKKQKSEKQAWEGLVNNKKYDPKKDEAENKAMRETSYAKLWDHQLQNTQGREAQWTYTFGIWDLGSMIFLGMALFRSGFFFPGFSPKKYALFAVGGLAVGLLLGWFRLYYNQLALQDYAKYISRRPLPYDLFYPLEIASMALGYAGLVLLLMNARFLQRVWRGIALAGQMALTNYLLQSIICLFFFTGFGMGYFARLQQWHLYVFAAEIALVNIAFSFLWLKHFHYGPAEWLWRSLVYKKWISNRKDDYIVQPVNAVP